MLKNFRQKNFRQRQLSHDVKPLFSGTYNFRHFRLSKERGKACRKSASLSPSGKPISSFADPAGVATRATWHCPAGSSGSVSGTPHTAGIAPRTMRGPGVPYEGGALIRLSHSVPFLVVLSRGPLCRAAARAGRVWPCAPGPFLAIPLHAAGLESPVPYRVTGHGHRARKPDAHPPNRARQTLTGLARPTGRRVLPGRESNERLRMNFAFFRDC